MSIIAVDFDGTLTTNSGLPYWEDPFDEEPDEQMVELVNQLYHRGHTIIVYTARREDVRRETAMWLRRFDVKYHALRMEKLGYDLLIDDRAVAARVVPQTASNVEELLSANES